MDIVHPHVAGIDVHKKVIWVAVPAAGRRARDAEGDRQEIQDVLAGRCQKMAAWLAVARS